MARRSASRGLSASGGVTEEEGPGAIGGVCEAVHGSGLSEADARRVDGLDPIGSDGSLRANGVMVIEYRSESVMTMTIT